MVSEIKLLTVAELSIRWQRDEATIRRYVREGTLTPCEGVPGMMFHPEYISKLEGVELERFSPLEKRRLERELESATIENKRLKEIIARAQCLFTEAVFVMTSENSLSKNIR